MRISFLDIRILFLLIAFARLLNTVIIRYLQAMGLLSLFYIFGLL
jgi:hypothetical protein